MKIYIYLDEFKKSDPDLYRELAEFVKERGKNIEDMGAFIVESDAGYHDDLMIRLQKVAVEGFKLAEEYRKNPQPEPRPIIAPKAAPTPEPEVAAPQPPRTFAEMISRAF